MPGPLRVLALAQYPETAPSTRFRLAQFVPALRASNIAMTIRPFLTNEQYRIARGAGPLRATWHLLDGFRDLRTTIASSGAFDVVMVQWNLAPIMDRRFLAILRRKGIPLVYDFDDAVFLELVGGRRWLEFLRSPHETTTAFCRSADVVLAGNDHLVEFARDATGRHGSDRIRLLPSVVDTDRFKPASKDPGRIPTLISRRSRVSSFRPQSTFRSLTSVARVKSCGDWPGTSSVTSIVTTTRRKDSRWDTSVKAGADPSP